MQLDFIDNNIRGHTLLDTKVYEYCQLDCNQSLPPAFIILTATVATTWDKLDQKFRDSNAANDIVKKYSQDPDGDENSNLTKLLSWCWWHGMFEKIWHLSEHSSTTQYSYAISHKTAEILRPMPVHLGQKNWENSDRYA